MAKTNWTVNDIVKPEDMNQIGQEINKNAADIGEMSSGFSEHLADYASHVHYAPDTGTANAKVVALDPAPTAYVEGLAIAFKNAAQNTGAVTINVNGLGAKNVLKSNGNALTSGSLKANSIYTLRYNGTAFILQGEGGEYGNATAADVLAPKTIGTDAGLVTGTMPNRGAVNQTITSQGGQYSIPQGYHSGSGRVVAQFNNLTPDNVKDKVNIGGVIGNLKPAAGVTPFPTLPMPSSQYFWNQAKGVWEGNEFVLCLAKFSSYEVRRINFNPSGTIIQDRPTGVTMTGGASARSLTKAATEYSYVIDYTLKKITKSNLSGAVLSVIDFDATSQALDAINDGTTDLYLFMYKNELTLINSSKTVLMSMAQIMRNSGFMSSSAIYCTPYNPSGSYLEPYFVMKYGSSWQRRETDINTVSLLLTYLYR